MGTEKDHEVFIKKWVSRVKHAKQHHAPAFKEMQTAMDFAYYNAPPDWFKRGNYVVPVLRRMLKQKTAGLYARNPTATAERRTKIDTVLWNGDFEALQQAMQIVLSGEQGLAGTPEDTALALQIVQEATEVKTQMALRDRFGRTMEALFDYFIDECTPAFKSQMRQLVYRTDVCGVGFLKLDFQRIMEPVRGHGSIADSATLMAEYQRLVARGGETPEDRAAMENVEHSLRDNAAILREGPVFDFPAADAIIIDPACRHLDGFVGAGFIAEEMKLTVEEIQRTYNVDLRKNEKVAQSLAEEDGLFGEGSSDNRKICVWEIQDKQTEQFFTVCEHHQDYLRQPSAPRVRLERFWTVFPLVFEHIEHPEKLYPISTVTMAIDTQMEYNVTRMALKDHRKANKPKYLSKLGSLSDDEKAKFADHEPNEIIEVQATGPNDDPTKMVSPFQPYSIDPNQYSVSHVIDDIYRQGGLQEANLGGTSGATATESTIAEASREMNQSSEIDTLDDFLTEFSRSLGQLMLANLSTETVKKIAGKGAIWPDLSDDEIFSEITLKIRAGSSGRPNQAATLARFRDAMPFVQMLPGVNPAPLAKRFAEALEIPVEEMVIEGLPSINALNQMAQAQASVSDDPNAQGGFGGQNAAAPPQVAPDRANQAPSNAVDPGGVVNA